jgi:hypothetical protein
MDRQERSATAAERRRLSKAWGPLAKDFRVTEIDLDDPDLDPKHRDEFIALIRSQMSSLDEIIGRWYRRPQCNVPDCDCGFTEIAKGVCATCHEAIFIKRFFGRGLIGDFPQLRRFLVDHNFREGDDVRTIDMLTSSGMN